MKIADIINRLPEHMVNRIKEHAPEVSDLHSEKYIRGLFTGLSALEQQAMKLIMREIGYGAFDWRKLESAAETMMSGAQLKVAITRLRQKGIVFAIQKSWGELVYVLPFDMYGQWHKLLFPLQGHLTHALPDNYEEPRLTLELRLLRFLSYIGCHPLALKKDGAVQKRDLARMSAYLGLDDKSDGFELDCVESVMYPEMAAVLLDFALRLDLVVTERQQLKIRRDRLENWLSLGREEMRSQLYGIWKQVHLPPVPWQQHLIFGLEQADNGQWCMPDDLIDWLDQYAISRPDTAMCLDWFNTRWLAPLHVFGWLSLGRLQRESGHVRVVSFLRGETDSGEVSDTFIVQADLDVLVPPDVPFSLLWELELLGEFRGGDWVSVYRITKESVWRALENGRGPENIIGFLQKHAKYGISPNIIRHIEDWSGQFGQTTISPVMLLQFNRREIADAMAAHPEISGYLKKRVGPLSFTVDEDKVTELAGQLHRSGFGPRILQNHSGDQEHTYPHLTGIRPDNSSASLTVSLPSKRQGMFNEKIPQLHADFATDWPQTEDIYPDLHNVPAMWWKDYRKYHLSTCKQILQVAIEWKTDVRYKHGGVESRFRPTAISEGRHAWLAVGWCNGNKVTLDPCLWEEMQLILPGINDNN